MNSLPCGNPNTDLTLVQTNENVAKVMYKLGYLEGAGLIDCNLFDPKSDIEEITLLCNDIATDWTDLIDIRSIDEEGYIMEYADRVLQERYRKVDL